jgi:hypothetical protein
MPTEREGGPPPTEREKFIKNKVLQRTGGRIQKLEAEVIGNRVVIRGKAGCYYLKQLALQAALDALGAASAMRIELNVEVVGSSRSLRQKRSRREKQYE